MSKVENKIYLIYSIYIILIGYIINIYLYNTHFNFHLISHGKSFKSLNFITAKSQSKKKKNKIKKSHLKGKSDGLSERIIRL